MNKITSEQLIRGIFKYLNTEIVPCVENKFTQIMMKTVIISAETKMESYKNLVEEFLKSSFAQEFLEVDPTGTFEVETLIDSLRKAVNECGELVVKIPPVKFISPEEQILSFNSSDISKLKQYLTFSNK